MELEELVVTDIRWWPGRHDIHNTPLFIAENPEGSTIVVKHYHYEYSRCEDGRRYYTLKPEYRQED